jgi:hypothetical protein
MRTTSFAAPRRALLLIVVVLLLSVVATNAYANVRTPDGGEAMPYARIEHGYVVHTDEWAAIVFYRPTECVPNDFNLLDFYDENAFGCGPATTDGFFIWEGEPWFSAPVQIKLYGLGAVPVWFVAWSDLQAALADHELTMSELGAMGSRLVGTASFYSETLHPDGGAQVPMINQVARGMLDDGRSFQLRATFVTVGVMNVRIAFE